MATAAAAHDGGSVDDCYRPYAASAPNTHTYRNMMHSFCHSYML